MTTEECTFCHGPLDGPLIGQCIAWRHHAEWAIAQERKATLGLATNIRHGLDWGWIPGDTKTIRQAIKVRP